MIFIAIIFVKSTKKNPREKHDFRIISYVGRAHWRIDNWYLAQNIRLREVFYIAQIMTTLILHPHTISDLTLTSVRRNDVLKYAQSFLHFFKIWKIYANDMKNWQKIRNSTEKKQTNKQTNKKQQQKRQEKKNTPSYSQRQGQHYDI